MILPRIPALSRLRVLSMQGEFMFVEGSIRSPLGAPFAVRCPRFSLQVNMTKAVQ